jgi:hypothetical protein
MTAAEASALWTVAVTTAPVTKTTAKMAAKPATVRRAFKARMTDTHVFYAARCMEKTAAAISAFLRPYTNAVDNLNPS